MECKKTKYKDLAAAEQDIARIKKKSTRERLPNRAYHCPHCNGWHITSRPDHLETLQQNTELKEKVLLLAAEVELLKEHLAAEKSHNNQKANRVIRTNDTVKQLNETINKKCAEITALKHDNYNYMAKNIALQAHIAQLEKT